MKKFDTDELRAQLDTFSPEQQRDMDRDLLRPAPIRLFVFDNRVEVISPGALAGGLTEEDIRNGKTYQRNPYMATFATNALYYKV